MSRRGSSRRTRLVDITVAGVALQRLGELAWSKRNERRLRSRGAIEYGQSHYPAMVALHVGWLASTLLEARRSDRPRRRSGGAPTPVRVVALVVFVMAQPLRYWAITSLGDRWSTRVLIPPDEGAVTTGPYRWLDHPNYVAVVAEIAAAPLMLGAWRTATWATVANADVLRRRLRVERSALQRAATSADSSSAHS
ncbi:MAG: isoprenylcysteine carboxylmethyltransferase family protein [Ilumatobacter sp.]|uniref:isoprenylcysteine carboxyl methyltransferase family protein n=1 Tax=Ilumatobacter sp. TaxID=1967498 RepID=UPI003C707D8E